MQIKRIKGENKIENFDGNLKIKLSGDGTNIGKRLKIVNITYTIINESRVAMAEVGNYPLAILKCKEDYEGLKEALSDIKEELKNLKKINIDGIEYGIELFLGGDWKFLAVVCGIGAANQDFACIWCFCPRNKRFDTSKQWSLTDTTKGARTIEKITEDSKRKKNNCKHEPIF